MPPLETLNNDHSKGEIELPGQSGETIDLSSKGFHKVRQLGAGEFGEVALYYYNGSNPAYQHMCNSQGLVAIKLLSEPDVHEEATARIIAKHSESGQLDLSVINKTYPLEENGKLIGILSEYESYLDIKNERGEVTEFSSDLYSIIAKTFYPHYSHEFPGAGIVSALKGNPAVCLSQIACGMVKGQDTLHQMSILHQDSAARNFLIRTERDNAGNVLRILPKISDYGLTSILAEGETNGVYTNREKVPLRIIDAQVVKTGGNTSLLTDYYARKTAMMSILAQMLTPLNGENESLSMKPGKSQPIKDFLADRMGMFLDDSAALKQHLNNVKAYLEKCPDKHLKQEVELFIACYEPWLTFYPDGSDLKKAREQEMALFEQCTTRFVEVYYAHLRSNRTSSPPENFLLGLQRLNRIPVNTPIQNVIQGNINQCEREIAQKAKPLPTAEHRSMSHGARTMEQVVGMDHYGRIQTVHTVSPPAIHNDGETHYNNLLSREVYANQLNQGNQTPQNPTESPNPTSHYARTSLPINAPANEENDGEPPYSRMLPQDHLTGSPTGQNHHPSQTSNPSNQVQNSHYTSLSRTQPQSARETHPVSPHYAPLSSHGNTNTQTRGDYPRVIGVHPVNSLPKEPDITRKFKQTLPERHEAHASHKKTAIKAIWSDFVHEVEHQLDKLSPKDNVEEIRQKFKELLKDAQKEIKTLLHIKSSPAKAPSPDKDEDDNDSYHP